MDRFTVEVKETDIKPILKILEDEKTVPFNPNEARYLIYKNPPKDKGPIGDRHLARLSILKKFKPPGMENLITLLTQLDSPPVVKVIQPSQKPFIIKTTHSESSLRFEAHMSEQMSKLGVGPNFKFGKYARNANSRAYVMAEEYVSEEAGYHPLHEYRDTKFAIRELPELFGKLIGRMHKHHTWESFDGVQYDGYMWYKERFLNHLWLRPSDDSLRLVDFGEVRLIKPETKKEGTDFLYRERLSNEVNRAAQNLVFGIAYPFVYGISKMNDGMRNYEAMLETFCEAYNRETGFEESIGVGDIINLKPYKGPVN